MLSRSELLLKIERYYDYLSRAELVNWWRNGTLLDRLRRLFFRNTPKYKGFVDLYWNVPVISTARKISHFEMQLRDRFAVRRRGGVSRTEAPSTRRGMFHYPEIPQHRLTATSRAIDWTGLNATLDFRRNRVTTSVYSVRSNRYEEGTDLIDDETSRTKKAKAKPDPDPETISVSSSTDFPYLISLTNDSEELSFGNIELTSKEYMDFLNQTGKTRAKKINRRKLLKAKEDRIAKKLAQKFYKYFGTPSYGNFSSESNRFPSA